MRNSKILLPVEPLCMIWRWCFSSVSTSKIYWSYLPPNCHRISIFAFNDFYFYQYDN